jgi:hypothetical protein
MLNTIRFLETVGANGVSPADYAATVAALDVEQSEKMALLQRDHAVLNDLLGGRQTMFFAVCAPEEEPFREDPPAEDEPIGIPPDTDNPD